jgi:hypothetical protein
MSLPLVGPVVPLGEDLLHPLHDSWKLQAVLRLDIKPKPVIGDT